MNGAKQNYHDAADKALAASKTAESSNKESDHQAAVVAHTNAASIISRQEGLVGRSNASRVSNMHLNAAHEHGLSAVWPRGRKAAEPGDLQKAVSNSSLLKEFEVAGFSAKQ